MHHETQRIVNELSGKIKLLLGAVALAVPVMVAVVGWQTAQNGKTADELAVVSTEIRQSVSDIRRIASTHVVNTNNRLGQFEKDCQATRELAMENAKAINKLARSIELLHNKPLEEF